MATELQYAIEEMAANLIIDKMTQTGLDIDDAARLVATDILNTTDKWTENQRRGVVAEVAIAAEVLKTA